MGHLCWACAFVYEYHHRIMSCKYSRSCGACSFIGTASTMQIIAEAIGLALSGSALVPATSQELLSYAREAGRLAVKYAQTGNMRPSDIVTMESFENAILVHAAVAGRMLLLCRGCAGNYGRN